MSDLMPPPLNSSKWRESRDVLRGGKGVESNSALYDHNPRLRSTGLVTVVISILAAPRVKHYN